MAVAFSVVFLADMEKRMLAASPLKPFFWKRFNLSMTFSLWNIPKEEFSSFVNFANSFHPRSIFLVKCHPNAVFFSIPRYSKDHAFQLLELSIHKPTSSPLKLSSIHNIIRLILPPIQYKKGFFSKEKHYVFKNQLSRGEFYKYKRDFEQIKDSVTEAIPLRSSIKS